MSKERLEEIKSVYEDYKGLQKKGDFKQADIALLYLSENHIDWLINRVEELEKLIKVYDFWYTVAYEQNQRYKRALEKMASDIPGMIESKTFDYEKGYYRLLKMVQKALEGEE